MRNLLVLFACLGLIPTTSGQDKPVPPAIRPADATPSVCDGVTGNLVSNCGFEMGSFARWIATGDLDYSGVADYAADSGGYGSYWGSVGNLAYLDQTIDTNPGQAYQLWFSLTDTSDPDPSVEGSTYFEARWNGNSLVTLRDSPAFGWQGYCFNVTSDSGSSLIRFVFRHDPAYFYLDDVILVPTADACPSA